MKKITVMLLLTISFIAFAQTEKVGVNTESPTETLTVKGTARVTTLPEYGDHIETNSGGKYSGTGETFDPVGNVVADANGVLGIQKTKAKDEMIIVDTSNSGQFDGENRSNFVDLSASDKSNIKYVIFDGNGNFYAILPVAKKRGQIITFYSWGGLGNKVQWYNFRGPSQSPINRPSGTIEESNLKNVHYYEKGDSDYSMALSTKADNPLEFRYRKLQFIAIGNDDQHLTWWFNMID